MKFTLPDTEDRLAWVTHPHAIVLRKALGEQAKKAMTALRSAARNSSDPAVAVALSDLEAIEQMLEMLRT